MVQGQSRMFVLWNRAETPRHVVITLGSPAADAIGQAGFDGEIDTISGPDLVARFMLTFIDGALQHRDHPCQQDGSTSANFALGECCHEALQNTINIPPTLHKFQGEPVAVMVARDLDFSSVYGLAMRAVSDASG